LEKNTRGPSEFEEGKKHGGRKKKKSGFSLSYI
jgi:hypothetical protein